MAKWPSGSSTGFLLFILFNPGSSIDSCVALGKLVNVSELYKSHLALQEKAKQTDFM